MNYSLTWQRENEIALLIYTIDATYSDFVAANEALTEMLNAAARPLALVLNVGELDPHNVAWERTKATQTFIYHPNLSAVMVIGAERKRLLRLMLLVMFNLSNTTLNFMSSSLELELYLRRHRGIASAR